MDKLILWYNQFAMAKTKIFILLSLIIALGFFLRVYNIENAPPGVYPDEAVNGMDAIDAMRGDWQWFYPANNGREGLFMNLIALCFKLFGISVLTLRLPSIIFGTLAILGIYLLAKELFRNPRIGLIAAFLASASFWPINFSRISFRANMLPAILAFSFYFLFRGVRTKKKLDFAIGGLLFGAGLHTYISFRIAPLILAIMLLTLIISRKNFLKEYWKVISVFCVFAALAAAPMLYTFFVSHPEYWQSRTSEISILSPEVNQGNLSGTFFKSFSLSLLKYNFWGDQNWRHNFPPYPLLDPLTGIAFMFGLAYSFLKLLRLLALRFAKKIRDNKMETYAFLLSSFFIMLVPEFMTAEGNPHALRSIGTLPAVFIFSALTLNYFFEYAEDQGSVFKKTIAAIFIIMVITIGLSNAIKYHLVWANKPETARAFDKNLIDISDYLKTLPLSGEKFVVVETMERIPIQLFNYGQPGIEYVYPGQIDYLSPKNIDHFMVILTDKNDEIISRLQSKFPGLNLEERKNSPETSFYTLD